MELVLIPAALAGLFWFVVLLQRIGGGGTTAPVATNRGCQCDECIAADRARGGNPPTEWRTDYSEAR